MLLQRVEPLRSGTLETRSALALSLELVEEMMAAIELADPERTADITERRLSILERALEQKKGRRLRRRRRSIEQA